MNTLLNINTIYVAGRKSLLFRSIHINKGTMLHIYIFNLIDNIGRLINLWVIKRIFDRT